MALTDRATISYNCGPKNRAGQGGKATTNASVAQLTAGNIASQDTKLTAWSTAAAPLTLAAVVKQGIEHGNSIANPAPTAPLNKGEKWVCSMQETTGNQRYFTHTIPAPDKSGTHVLPNTLDANLSDADWTAYAAAAVALLTTPDGNAMAFNGATILTRRR
jgi:hypothetical protein